MCMGFLHGNETFALLLGVNGIGLEINLVVSYCRKLGMYRWYFWTF